MGRTAWELDQIVDIEVADKGLGALKPTTFMQTFKKTVKRVPNHPALRYQKDGEPDQWYTYTYKQYYDQCLSFAKALIAMGLQRHDVVNIIGFNSPEWFFANNGTIFAGGVSAGIYTTNGADACKYISAHSQAKCVVVENRKHLDKYLEIAADLPHLKAIVVWAEEPPKDVQCPVKIYSYADFLKSGEHVDEALVHARTEDQKPGECCTLIYTSGTTGPPKAVMISHDNLTWTAANAIDLLQVTHEERTVSFLPLSHVAAQIIDIFVPVQLGCTVHFASPDALKGSLVKTLKDVRPTFFFGVPRVWEKIMEKMKEIGSQTTGVKKMVAEWAKARGASNTRRNQFRRSGSQSASIGYHLANSIVLSKIKEALGLDQTKLCVTGAAPISAETLNYFGSLDIPVYELFGQSECTGPHAINIPGKWKVGTVGRGLNGTETRIDKDTGEIQYKGRHVFMGYLHDEESTKKTVVNGYLCSGDVGKIDEDGFLMITGRIKELIITAGGENVPPVLIEDALKAELPAISNVMVIGDRRKYLTFVCTLRTKMDPEGLPLDELDRVALQIAQEIGSPAKTVDEAQECPKWKEYITAGMKRVNANATSRAQNVQKFVILPRDFSIPGGELTPTLKLKRAVVNKMYADLIEGMYGDA